MRIYFKGRDIEIDAVKMNGLGKFRGLMFRFDKMPLLFSFDEDVRIAIHSLFVWFKFLAVWLDSNGNVLDLKVVKKFRFYARPDRKFRHLIEIPICRRNIKSINFFLNGAEKPYRR